MSLSAQPIAPYILSQPTSRAADQGSSVKLNVTAAGTAPLSYQWQFNGANIPGATTNRYSLSNAQTTNSGDYRVLIANSYGSVASRVASVTVYPPQLLVFADNFDTNSASKWTISSSSPDTRIIFNYDYSADGIPSAPHSIGGTTRGVRFQANLTNGTAAALNMSPIGQSFFGDYRLRFDMWVNANGPFPAGGISSTQFVTAGIGSSGLSPAASDGYWFSVDGQGGMSDVSDLADVTAYIGSFPQPASTGIYWAGANPTARDNANPYYAADFPGGQKPPLLQQMTYPQQTGALSPGTVGFIWCDVMISKQGNTIEWSLNGLKIATITNASFTGNNVFVGYWNPFSAVSDNPSLSFGLVDNLRVEQPISAPAILVQPQSIAVNQGASAAFSVLASSIPPPAYQWRFNGSNIPGATNSTYSLTNVQPTNLGGYSVVLTNIAGSATSLSASLTLNSPPSISEQPQTQTVNQGSAVTFAALATGTQPLSYQWLFDGSSIPSATAASFTVTSAQAADAGVYSVVVSNIAGVTISRNASLFVNIPPSFIRQPQGQYVNQGDNVSFTVAVSGTPPFSYQWRFSPGASVPWLNFPWSSNSTLTIANVQPSNAGAYSVVVSNLAGIAASSNAILRVNLPPVADASATQPSNISSNGTNAVVVLDASRSYDPDGDALRFLWLLSGSATPLATGVVAVAALPVGTNVLQLIVSDLLASSTNFFTITILTTSQAEQALMAMVNNSRLPHSQDLIASLSTATTGIHRQSLQAAINQLQAFQNKIRAQVAPAAPALAAQLTDTAQQVIDALNDSGNVRDPKLVAQSTRVGAHGQISFIGARRQTYIIEASTNLIDWEPIGVATAHSDGSFDFQDKSAPGFPARFYRTVSP